MLPASVNDIMKPAPHSKSVEPEIENVEKSIGVAKGRALSSKAHSQQGDNLNELCTNRMLHTSANSGGYFPIWVRRIILFGAQGLCDQESGNRHEDDSNLHLRTKRKRV